MMTVTPRSIVAGRVSASSGNPLEVALESASTLLGVNQVALIVSRMHGYVWYLAAPASDMGGEIHGKCPLAIALPGNAGHEGEGAYILDLAVGLQAVIICAETGLKSYVGSPELVQRFIELEGARKTTLCRSGGVVWAFPEALAVRKELQVLRWATGSGVFLALISGLAWLWAVNQTDVHQTALKVMETEYRTAWQGVAEELVPAGYPKALSHLQKAVEHAVREKGVLLQFEFKNGRSVWSLHAHQRTMTGEAH